MPTTTTTPPPYPAELPAHWRALKLRNILSETSLRNRPDLPLLSVVREQGVILRDTTNQDENHNFIPDDLSNYKVVRKGQFAINKMKAWQGSYGVSQYDGIVSPAYFVFDVHGVQPDYFHTAIRSAAFVPFFAQASDGVRIGQWDLSKVRMREILFPLPPPDEQAAIVRYLDDADARLRRRRDARRRLRALRLEERQALIRQAVTQGLRPNAPRRPSGLPYLGSIPAHWEVRRLASCIHKLQSGMREQGNATADDGIPNLGGEHISADSQLNLNNMRYVSRQFFEKLQRGIIQQGDILLVKDGATIGKTALVREMPYAECSINEHVYIVRPTPVLSQSLLFYNILAPGVQDAIWQQVTGSAQPGLNASFAKAIYIAVPPPDEQAEIVAYLETELGRIEAAMARDRRLAELYDEYRLRLTADAVTGRLDVRRAAADGPAPEAG